jgi:hypothetical protein
LVYCIKTNLATLKIKNVRKIDPQVSHDHEEELGSAASFLIREWVEKLLGVKFESLRELALYLIDKMYVDNRSAAAHTVLSVMTKSGTFMLNDKMPNGKMPSKKCQITKCQKITCQMTKCRMTKCQMTK